jgi:hypothetical protein
MVIRELNYTATLRVALDVQFTTKLSRQTDHKAEARGALTDFAKFKSFPIVLDIQHERIALAEQPNTYFTFSATIACVFRSVGKKLIQYQG